MTFMCNITDADSRNIHWHNVDWRRVNRAVRRLQTRIVKAVKAGKWRLVKNLQRLLVHSLGGRLLAVKRVTENKGKNTSGVDKVIWETPEQKIRAVSALKQSCYQAQPLRRVYIPKANGKRRALGIPVMHDRAQQALHKLALEPIAECLADGHSYGFRPMRSTQDAIEQVFNTLCRKSSAKWVLEGDIKACFDEIDADWLLQHIPIDKTVLKQWLKAGYIEKDVFHSTDRGTPQGGIISPILANMCLDGLEAAIIHSTYEKRHYKLNVVRYADDFIVTSNSKEWLDTTGKPRICAFLAERGLQLSPEKTHITHVSHGFDFLGWTVRKYPDQKLIIKPSRKSIKSLIEKTRKIFQTNRQAKTCNIISLLNPIIRGWANYHRSQVAKKVFSRIDSIIFWQSWHWAKRRHPNKSAHWVRQKYFVTQGNNHWVFAGVNEDGKRLHLFKASRIPIERHRKIHQHANPYDPDWDHYFDKRQYLNWLKSNQGRGKLCFLWKRQKGLCPVCGTTLIDITSIRSHHIIPKSQGGTNAISNLVLAHANCIQQMRYIA